MLTISDNLRSMLSSDWIAMLAHITGDSRWKGLLANRLSGDLEEVVGNHLNLTYPYSGVRTLIYGPDDLSGHTRIVPAFRIHESAGHATSRREASSGSVRLHLCGSSATEGHSHADKGAIILEAFGESLLVDRGITEYNDPLSGVMKVARLHNVITPVGKDGVDLDQLNPCSAAACPVGESDGRALHLRIDISPAWDTAVVSHMTRDISSLDPCQFTITDEISLTEALPVVFHLHSYHPITVEDHRAIFTGQHSHLHVTWAWDGEVIFAATELHDFSYTPVYHLAIRAGEATAFHLETQLEIIPINTLKD